VIAERVDEAIGTGNDGAVGVRVRGDAEVGVLELAGCGVAMQYDDQR
jgi:hypothetical protein